jgi:hypothetical protein
MFVITANKSMTLQEREFCGHVRQLGGTSSHQDRQDYARKEYPWIWDVSTVLYSLTVVPLLLINYIWKMKSSLRTMLPVQYYGTDFSVKKA